MAQSGLNCDVSSPYKSYKDTYTMCYRCLEISKLYPDPANFRRRLIIISLVFLTIVPMYLAYMLYLFKCFANMDVPNLTQQITLGVLAFLYIFKIFYITIRTKEYGCLIEMVNKDLAKVIYLEQSYWDIYDEYIKTAKFGQICWFWNCIGMITAFIMISVLKMLHAYVTDSDQKRYMIHDMEFKYFEDKQYEFPYFECIWMYMVYVCGLWVPSYIGFDGSFCIFTTHVALRMKLIAHKLKKAFEESKDINELRSHIRSTIEDHQTALSYYNLIQSLHSTWLFIVFGLTSIVISLNIYQVMEGSGIEIKFAIITTCSSIHTLIPCYFGSVLREVGNRLPNEIYCCAWEKWQDPISTKMLALIIVRAQQPLTLTAQGFVPYDMELFLKIFKTAYSFYTLLRD